MWRPPWNHGDQCDRPVSGRVLIGRRLLFCAVGAPVNEDELRVVGPATAQQLRRLRLPKDVFAPQSEEVRGHLPKHPDAKRHQ
jgi:hypothetical protein